ncbi:hypothetical protein [Limosilactobacillus reuteri]|uniref:hypothetical protein n=1 Tax=Limosilactobacillus reuteri TaxID=1598 RepID=UPI002B0574BB|nr:hypothetical protein [Limosilactobacillus reuteri]
MTNQKRLNYINSHNLNIEEHTIINVDQEQLLEDPADPESYVDDSTINIYLSLSTCDGKQLVIGDSEDLMAYIDAQIAAQTK